MNKKHTYRTNQKDQLRQYLHDHPGEHMTARDLCNALQAGGGRISLPTVYRHLEKMVAAYVLGYSFTTEDLAANPALKFAEGADDTGVIVSWNTEGPGNKYEENSVVKPGAIAINPLNWKRDDTYAPASENLGDRLPDYDESGINALDYQVHTPGIADARLDTERGVVVCTTMPDRYIKALAPGVRNVFGPASLHTGDYPNYWENIRENVRTRTRAYFQKH